MRPLSICISNLIGREDFDGAVDYLRAGLKGDASDLDTLKMIAHCHHWAGNTDDAIAVSREALIHDPALFEMHAILAQLLADKGEHEDACFHACKGLVNYPEPQPEPPGLRNSIAACLSRISATEPEPSPNLAMQWVKAGRTEWFDWAKQYLNWYETTRGETVKPTEH
ncbi:MAG: tetratricopeptide repeat protein [Hyphomicrobiaceae bacterium]